MTDQPTPTPTTPTPQMGILDLPYRVQAHVLRIDAFNAITNADANFNSVLKMMGPGGILPPNFNPGIHFAVTNIFLEKAKALVALSMSCMTAADQVGENGDPRESVQVTPASPSTHIDSTPTNINSVRKPVRDEPRGIS